MKINYSEFFSILWAAKKSIKKDIKDYNYEEDEELLKKTEELIEFINKNTTTEFLIVEIPF